MKKKYLIELEAENIHHTEETIDGDIKAFIDIKNLGCSVSNTQIKLRLIEGNESFKHVLDIFDGIVSISPTHLHNQAGSSFANLFQVYLNATKDIKEVVESMTKIHNDPDADSEERAAAMDTLLDVLFPPNCNN